MRQRVETIPQRFEAASNARMAVSGEDREIADELLSWHNCGMDVEHIRLRRRIQWQGCGLMQRRFRHAVITAGCSGAFYLAFLVSGIWAEGLGYRSHSERSNFIDDVTGATITRLTSSPAKDDKIYQTSELDIGWLTLSVSL
jgi:hypothetical protein